MLGSSSKAGMHLRETEANTIASGCSLFVQDTHKLPWKLNLHEDLTSSHRNHKMLSSLGRIEASFMARLDLEKVKAAFPLKQAAPSANHNGIEICF